MSAFTFRTMVVLMVAAVFLAPLYAHHGTQFLSKAMEMNTAEVQLAEMAVNKTQNPQVKEYAEMLVRDHNKALDEIKQLRDARLADSLSSSKSQVDTKTATTTADIKLTPEHQRTVERLSKLSGPEFDRAFMDVMVREHRMAIKDFEAQTRAHGNTISSTKPKDTTTGQGTTTREKPTAPDQKKYSRSELSLDLDTAQFASAALPMLRQHLQQAEAIQRALPQIK